MSYPGAGTITIGGQPIEVSQDSDLLAGNRLRVDVGEAGFFEGRQFRISHEFNIDSSGPAQVIEVVIGTNIILTKSEVSVDQGGIDYHIAIGGTVGGTFDTTIPVIPKNSMTDVGVYSSQLTFTAGGTVTGYTKSPLERVRSASGNNARSSGVSGDLQSRGFAPQTLYLVLAPLDGTNDDARGILKLEWEER